MFLAEVSKGVHVEDPLTRMHQKNRHLRRCLLFGMGVDSAPQDERGRLHVAVHLVDIRRFRSDRPPGVAGSEIAAMICTAADSHLRIPWVDTLNRTYALPGDWDDLPFPENLQAARKSILRGAGVIIRVSNVNVTENRKRVICIEDCSGVS